MDNDFAVANEIKAIERWENEGGKVSPFNSLRTSSRSFRTEDNSREGQAMDMKLPQQVPVFSELNVWRAV